MVQIFFLVVTVVELLDVGFEETTLLIAVVEMLDIGFKETTWLLTVGFVETTQQHLETQPLVLHLIQGETTQHPVESEPLVLHLIQEETVDVFAWLVSLPYLHHGCQYMHGHIHLVA